MDVLIRFVIAAFACYRIARLLVIDDGPFDVFLKIRQRVGVFELGADDRPRTNLGRLFECPHCIGVWIALPLGLYVEPNLAGFVAWLAIAGAQSFLWGLNDRR